MTGQGILMNPTATLFCCTELINGSKWLHCCTTPEIRDQLSKQLYGAKSVHRIDTPIQAIDMFRLADQEQCSNIIYWPSQQTRWIRRS